jgi:alpha-1,6-mannosyltransferase
MADRRHPILIAYFLLVCGAQAFQSFAPTQKIWSYIALHLILGLLMTFYVFAAKGVKVQRDTWLWVVAALSRLIWIGAEPYTSEDMWRYLWDGAVLVEGFDPYHFAPIAPALEQLRQYWPLPPSNTSIPTLYPPLALALFAMASWVGAEGAFWAWKLMLALVSLGILAVMAILCQRLQKQYLLGWVALHPLLILEAGVGAHLDTWVALWLILALLAWQHKRAGWTGVFLGLGVITKLTPLVFVPFFAITWRDRQRYVFGASLLSVVFGAYLLAGLWGLSALGSLGHFITHWSFGSPFMSLLSAFVPPMLARWLSLAGLVFALSYHLWRSQKICAAEDPNIAALSSMLLYGIAIFWFFCPVVYPWYLMPMVVLWALRPNVWVWCWMMSFPLTYEVVISYTLEKRWEPALWPLIVLVSATALGAGVDVARKHRWHSLGF